MKAYYPQIITSANMLDSIIKVEDLAAELQKYDEATVAITDTKLYGLLHFYKEMTKNKIKPVLALTTTITWEDNLSLPIVLYAENDKGYKHLLKITSAISLRAAKDLPLKWLSGYKAGLQVMIPTRNIEEIPVYESKLDALVELFPNKIYLGVERSNNQAAPEEAAWMEIAEQKNIPMMATQKVTFLDEQDVVAYEAALAIKSGMRIEDRDPLTEVERAQYLPTMDQMTERFKDHPQWLENTVQLLNQCQVTLSFDTHHMPKYHIEMGQTAGGKLLEQCMLGMAYRGVNGLEQYEKRLAYELSIINNMGYADYFLIVADYIQYARSKQILTGPGRGSSASSLVAYCLQITNVDPIKYDLLFERFLNPERITLPDIDVDFADSKRQEVIEYVAEKYGAQFTSQIITFGTLSAKAVGRDVARVLGFTTEEMSEISSLLSSRASATLRDSLPELQRWVADDSKRHQWLEIALKLEGLKRNASTHAAGVVLSPIPLTDIVPIEKGAEKLFITQWPMKEIEEIGLLKMDFLGLRNLSTLDHIRSLIYFNEKRMLDFEKIPLHDAKTFDLLQRGDTTGVFQLESSGMRQALKEIKPTTFLDIVAINALYRPGPMDFIPVYSRRKHGLESVVLPHPALAEILNETFGVIVYQEQIMRIASVFAGFSLGEADILRRAVSKKNKDSLDAERVRFVAGSVANGYPKQLAHDIYDLIVRFANYGFPKSHAVAYSLITYQMAYLKANFTPYFYAALLTNVLGDKEKQLEILQEAKGKGIEILPPSLSKSGKGYRIEDGKIRIALSGIRGVPQNFITKLQQLKQQNEKQWTNIFELALALSATYFKKSTIEPLIHAGALDEFGRGREVLLATVERAEKLAKIYAPNDETMLFYDTAVYGVPKHAEAEIIDELTILENEKMVLGYYISTHPVEAIKRKLQLSTVSINGVSTIKIGTQVKVVALVRAVKVIRTKNGEQMAFLQLEDETSSISGTIFPQTFEKVKDWLLEDQMIQTEGKVEFRNQAAQLIINKIELVDPT